MLGAVNIVVPACLFFSKLTLAHVSSDRQNGGFKDGNNMSDGNVSNYICGSCGTDNFSQYQRKYFYQIETLKTNSSVGVYALMSL